MPNIFSRVAVAQAVCGEFVAAVELLPGRNPNHIRFRLTFQDGTHLHISEEWRHGSLGAYSYYWLDERDALIQGWDNAPHHPQLANYPHHMHVGAQHERRPSYATTLEEVLAVIRSRLDQS